MKTRRYLVLAPLLVSAFLFAQGCGKQQDTPEEVKMENSQEEQNQIAQGQAETTDGGKTKLTFWHVQSGDPMKSNVQDSVDRFMAENPQYEVEVVPMANDAYKTKLKIAMGAGETPDVFTHWSGGPMIEYINADAVADITSYMEADNYKDKFMEGGIDQVTYQDKIWGVPVENVSIAGVFYNKEIFEEYNLKIPTTISELETVCDTLIDNGIIPFALANKTKWTGSMYYGYLVSRIGGVGTFADAVSGENGGSFTNEVFTQAGNKLQEWVEKGYFGEGFNGMDVDAGQDRQLLYADKAAMQVMGSWLVSSITGENPDYVNKLGFFQFPAMDGSKVDPDILLGTIGDNFYSVSKNSKDVEGAFKLITYLIDDAAVEKRMAAGKIPPLKGVTGELPIHKDILTCVEKAPAVQLWYDQYLSPELGELHKDTSQALFALSKTPEEVNEEMQKAIENYRSK